MCRGGGPVCSGGLSDVSQSQNQHAEGKQPHRQGAQCRHTRRRARRRCNGEGNRADARRIENAVVLPVKLIEFAVKPETPNEPLARLPETRLTPPIEEPLKFVRLIVKEPETEVVLPKKVKATCVAVTDTELNKPEVLQPSPSMQNDGPAAPTVKGPGAGAPVIGTDPVALDETEYVSMRSAMVFVAQIRKIIAIEPTLNPRRTLIAQPPRILFCRIGSDIVRSGLEKVNIRSTFFVALGPAFDAAHSPAYKINHDQRRT